MTITELGLWLSHTLAATVTTKGLVWDATAGVSMTITELGLWLSHTLAATVTTKSLVWDATAGVSMTITELDLWVTSHTGCHGYDKEFGLRCHSWGFHDYYRAWFVTESHTGCHGYDKEFGLRCHSWGFHDYYRAWFVTESHTGCHGYDKEFGLRCHSWGFHDYYRAWFVGDVTHRLPRLRQRGLVWDATVGVSMTITELGLWVTSHTVCHGYDKEFGLKCHSWGFHDYYRAWFVGDVTHWLPRLWQRVWFQMPQLGFPWLLQSLVCDWVTHCLPRLRQRVWFEMPQLGFPCLLQSLVCGWRHTLAATVTTKSLVWDATAGVSMTVTELGLWVTSHSGLNDYDAADWKAEWLWAWARCSDVQPARRRSHC